jgi:pimeloyl-ACP methyl ester carboxylesterase
VLHGIRDNKRTMLDWGRRIANAGFSVVLVDLRGHGSSSGPFLTYGVVERQDLRQLLDKLLSRGLVAPPFAAFGASYGAASAIQLAGVDRRIVAVVAVAPFADVRSVVPSYLRLYLPGLWRLIPSSRVREAVDRAGVTAGFDPDQASPRLLVRSATAQVMIFHGTDDQKIPPWHSKLIQAQAPRRVKRVVIPGRDHDNIMGDPEMSRRALKWLKHWLAPHA